MKNKIPGRLEITTRIGCKMNCVYCPQKLLMTNYFKDNLSRRAVLSLEDFKTCLKKIPAGTRIDFSGMAEPWLNEQCTDMVCHAADEGFPIAIYTTLVGMSLKDFERIKDLDFDEFVLHVPDDKSNANIQITEEYLSLLYQVTGKAVVYSVAIPDLLKSLHDSGQQELANALRPYEPPPAAYITQEGGVLHASAVPSHRKAGEPYRPEIWPVDGPEG